ncbi:uncharacterized protein L199_003558 [Kwoniella botswanensis]|uniref:uncharacterized protein n=1 Tax=Kwoniella botswanensis TaxID=1268659 RepID=UPI00315DBA31
MSLYNNSNDGIGNGFNKIEQSSKDRHILDDQDDPFGKIWFIQELKARPGQEAESYTRNRTIRPPPELTQESDNFNYDPTKVLEWTGTVAGSDTVSGRGQQDDHFAVITESNASEHPTHDRGHQMGLNTSISTTEEEQSTTEKSKPPHGAKVKSSPSADQEEIKQGSVMPLSASETETKTSVSIVSQSSERPRAWASLFQSTVAPCAASTAGTSAPAPVETSSASGVCLAKEAARISNDTQPEEVEKIEDAGGEFITVIRVKRQSRKSTDRQDKVVRYAAEDSRPEVYSYDEIDARPKDKVVCGSEKWDLDTKTHWGRGFR